MISDYGPRNWTAVHLNFLLGVRSVQETPSNESCKATHVLLKPRCIEFKDSDEILLTCAIVCNIPHVNVSHVHVYGDCLLDVLLA